MLKRLLALITAILAVFTISAASLAADVLVNSISIRVDGSYIKSDNFILDSTTYIQLNTLLDAFGLESIFDEDRNLTIREAGNNGGIEKTDYSPSSSNFVIDAEKSDISIYVNGNLLNCDSYIYNDAQFVPLRVITEALGYTVYYDEPTKSARIYTNDYIDFNDEIVLVYGESKKIVTREQFTDLANFMYQTQLEAGQELEFQDIIDLFFYNLSVEGLAKKLDITISDEDYELFLDANQIREAINQLGFLVNDEEAFIENYVKREYVSELVTQADLTNVYIPTDEEVILEFAKSDYAHGNWMKAKHILISKGENGEGLEKAEKILEEIKTGADFDELMMENSEDPGTLQYPDGYTFKENQMVDEFYEGALNLAEDEVSDIIETEYGYHIIKKVADYKNGLPFQDIKDGLYESFAVSALQNDFAQMRINLDVVLNQKLAFDPEFITVTE